MRRIRTDAGTVCALAHERQKKRRIREAMILIRIAFTCTCDLVLSAALCVHGPSTSFSQLIAQPLDVLDHEFAVSRCYALKPR